MSAPSYPAVNDQIMLGRLQDMLLEVNNNGSSMSTGMYSLQQLINALNQASYDFQRDVGVVADHIGFQGDTLNGIPMTPNQEQVALPQDMMDVRRRAWISFDTQNPVQVKDIQELPVQDSLALDSNVPTWEATLGTPYTADESLPPVPAMNLSFQPVDIGQVDLIYTPVPNQLSNTGIPLSFPPDFSVAILYCALQILFSLQGEGADDQRARFCGQQYALLVQLSKAMLFLPNMTGPLK
jgi:hypothetical protein